MKPTGFSRDSLPPIRTCRPSCPDQPRSINAFNVESFDHINQSGRAAHRCRPHHHCRETESQRLQMLIGFRVRVELTDEQFRRLGFSVDRPVIWAVLAADVCVVALLGRRHSHR